MSKRKLWNELNEVTRARRFEAIASNMLPKQHTINPMASVHSRCRDGANCTGPGCKVRKQSRQLSHA